MLTGKINEGQDGSFLERGRLQGGRDNVLRRTGGGVFAITAPFFERRGFGVVREQRVSRRDVSLTNFAMEKDLTG
jgi:hypothetical protein